MQNLQPVSQNRVQMYFPDSLYRILKEESAKANKSIAELVRSSVKEKYTQKIAKADKKREKAWKEFMALAGCVSDKSDVSVNHDKYIGEALEQEAKSWGK